MQRSPLLPTAAALLAAAMLLAAPAVAQDWPQWLGPERLGRATGFDIPPAWPPALEQAWKTTVGLGDATPALVGDRLYVFVRQENQERLLCLAAADGKELWRSEGYDATAVTGPARGHGGPRSSPAVAAGKVLTHGVGGILACWDAADGKLRWRKDEFKDRVPQFYTSMSPLVLGETVVALMGGPNEGAIVAYALADGAERWRWTGDAAAYSSPVAMTVGGEPQIVAMTNRRVVGLRAADGVLRWEIPFVPQGRSYNAPTPIVDGATVYLTAQGQGTRALEIVREGEGFAARPKWHNAEVATYYNTPVLKDGLLFGLSDRGYLFCLKADDGQTAWIDTTRRSAFGAIVDAGSVLVALVESGDLIVYRPSAAGFEQLAAYKVCDTPTYAFPILSGKRIFVKDRESLIAWRLP